MSILTRIDRHFRELLGVVFITLAVVLYSSNEILQELQRSQPATSLSTPQLSRVLGVGLEVAILLIAGHLLAPLITDWLFEFSQRFQKKTLPSHFASPAPANTPPDLSVQHLRELRTPGCEVWVIASGKGGVGKSLVALGVTEYVARREPLLLCDFDLHNRGLTSALGFANPDSPELSESAFSLLEQLRSLLRDSVLPASEPLALGSVYSERRLPKGFSTKHFNVLMEKYARECRLEPKIWGEAAEFSILKSKFHAVPIRPGHEDVHLSDGSTIYNRNFTFLPSRARAVPFLLSEVSTLSYLAVFLWVKALATWTKQATNNGRIVLDCHGAHDSFTAGAILAADRLVVVTSPDSGSVGGTAELLE